MKLHRTFYLLVLAFTLVLASCNTRNQAHFPSPGDPLPYLKALTKGAEPGIIVDSAGRQVLLRGGNVNSHVEYWQYDPEDDYFKRHLNEQDNYLFGATIWTWHTSCGDPASVQIEISGLGIMQSVPWFGGTLFYAPADGGDWSVPITTVS